MSRRCGGKAHKKSGSLHREGADGLPCSLSQVAGAVEVPVIGCGGITTTSDAIEFIMAGASAIQVGTASFTNPRAPLDVLEGIRQFMKKEGIKDITELIGAARG